MNTKDMRRIIVQAAHHAKHGHMPSALSLVEILKAYSEVQQKDPKSAGSRGLEFVSKKIEATKKINHPIVKNKVDQNKK